MPAGAAVTVSKKLTRAEPSGFHVNHLYVKDRRNHPAASNERLKSEHKPVGRATAFAPPRPEALRSEIMTNANQPFLLGPGIGQRAGKPCEGEITGRGAIKECRHNAGRVVLIVRGATFDHNALTLDIFGAQPSRHNLRSQDCDPWPDLQYSR